MPKNMNQQTNQRTNQYKKTDLIPDGIISVVQNKMNLYHFKLRGLIKNKFSNVIKTDVTLDIAIKRE